MPRLRSDIFVSALLRRVEAQGGFGVVAARGNAEAGAVHVEWRWHGAEGLYAPAPAIMDEGDGTRRFLLVPDAASEQAIAERMRSERCFDEAAWHVAIEGVDPEAVLDVAIEP